MVVLSGVARNLSVGGPKLVYKSVRFDLDSNSDLETYM